ncbi:MAG TPA: hypothetical protein ENI64_00730 [Gammaproteobacteria bacterium]|nr:hypothetical protein [Gammaproteobacteria bacterium]
MPQHFKATNPYLFSLLILLISFLPLQMVYADTTGSSPGGYCPSANILLISAEDLSSSLALIMRSRAAQAKGNFTEMASTLIASGATLQQAASRGAGARTAVLIDSIILAKIDEDYDQLLTWFPLLHSAILSLPNDMAQGSAESAVGNAEAIMKEKQTGNPLDQLRKARHFLTCDGLNLPLQEAIDEQSKLVYKAEHKSTSVVPKDYDKIITSLHNAMTFTLKQGDKEKQ